MSARGRAGRLLRWTVPIGLVVAAAFALAPSLLAPVLAARMSAAAGVPVRVGWLTWNPLAGRVVAHHLSVALAPDTPPVVTVRALTADVALRRLLAGDVVLTQVAIDQPWVALRRTATGDFNLGALLRAPVGVPSPTPPASGGVAASPAPRVSASPGAAAEAPERTLVVGTLRVRGGSIEFRDETTTPVLETSLNLEDVAADDLAIALSGRANVRLHLESRLEQRPLTLDLTYLASGDDSKLSIELATTGVALDRTLVYVPLGWRQISGTLDLTLSYAREVTHGRLGAHALSGHAIARDIAFAEPWASEPTVRAAHARLGRITVDFVRRRTEIGEVSVEGFQAVVARDEEGLHVPFATPRGAAADSAWTTVVPDVTLGAGEVALRNVVPGADAELRASVRSGRLRTEAGEVRLTLDTTTSAGAIDLDGRFGDAPTLRLTFRDVGLPELAARLRLPVGFATGTLSGTVDIDRLGDETPRFSGSLRLAGGRTVPVDPAWPHEMLAWQDLTVDVAEATFAPPRIHLRRLTAEWPYAMIHRTAKGLFPVTLFHAAAPADEAADSGGAATPDGAGALGPAWTIDEVVLRHGRAEFWDTTLTPPYWTELTDAELSASTLAYAPFTVHTATVAGAVDELSPLQAHARREQDQWTIDTTVERLRLVPLNAYLEPILHYAITSGVARIVSNATLAGSRFASTNDVVLSRFSLTRTGEDVLQPELGAPLSVALALMKDYRGDIRLELPVEGDLATREFAVRNVMSTALKKSLLGALSAPVTLLGAAFHRDEEERFDLKPVPFPPGSAELQADGEARIAELARLLARHTELDAVLIPDPSTADATAFGTPPGAPPLERLAALADARARAVVARLVDVNQIAPARIGQVPWTPGPLDPETVPGVDVQLRGR